MRILLVEDEPAAGKMLSKGLREAGYAVDTAQDGIEARYKASINPYDLIILDIVLQGQDGFGICRGLRSSGFTSPVLMLTARDSVEDRIHGLETGADDYLTKPFDYLELLARVRALLRRRRKAYVEIIHVGDLRIDLRANTVTRAGASIELTAKEYTILEYLASRQGQLVSREDLSEHAWDENYDPFSNLIEVYILRLRKKIDATHPVKLLRTRRGKGYMLCASAEIPVGDV